MDNALPPRLATMLREAWHDVVHLREYRIQSAPDDVVLYRAINERRVLLSADTDFGALLAHRGDSRASFILFREPSLVHAEDYAVRLLRLVPVVEPELDKGAIVVFRNGLVRVRRLPIGDR